MGLLLTIITFVPLLGALVILLIPKSQERLIKYLSIAISVIPFGLATYLWFAYDKAAGGIQFETSLPWIPTLNINYHLGADGLSILVIPRHTPRITPRRHTVFAPPRVNDLAKRTAARGLVVVV